MFNYYPIFGTVNFTVVYISGLSILLAGVIGLFRIKDANSLYYPFFFFFWLGGFNEVLSIVLANRGINTIVNNNIYVLLESLLLLWLFQKQGLFRKVNWLLITLISILCITWGVESFIIRNLLEVSVYFRIVYSFIIVLLSVYMINQLLTSTTSHLLQNATFLVCIGLVSYFTLKILVESFWLYGLTTSKEFRLQIYRILIYVNLFVNLIYAVAALWIPRKQPSILQLSYPLS